MSLAQTKYVIDLIKLKSADLCIDEVATIPVSLLIKVGGQQTPPSPTSPRKSSTAQCW